MTEVASTLLQTPLHARHVELGARMVPFAGWEMPIQYASILEERSGRPGTRSGAVLDAVR